MAKENSFDIVSKTDYAEMTNAIHQTMKEVSQRFDFKGSKAAVELQDKDLLLTAEDDTKLRNMNDILQSKLVKRGVSLKALDYQKAEPAAGGTVRQAVKVQQGIPIEKAKEVVRCGTAGIKTPYMHVVRSECRAPDEHIPGWAGGHCSPSTISTPP